MSYDLASCFEFMAIARSHRHGQQIACSILNICAPHCTTTCLRSKSCKLAGSCCSCNWSCFLFRSGSSDSRSCCVVCMLMVWENLLVSSAMVKILVGIRIVSISLLRSAVRRSMSSGIYSAENQSAWRGEEFLSTQSFCRRAPSRRFQMTSRISCPL